MENIPPVSTWGDHYLLTPFLGRTSGYVYRIVTASTDVTNVTISGRNRTVVSLSAGQFYEGNVASDELLIVTADQSIMVAQYAKGYNTDSLGDPFMVVVPPTGRFTNNVTFPVVTLSEDDPQYFISIISGCDNMDQFYLDGMPLDDVQNANLLQSPDGEFCVVRTPVTPVVHSVNHPTASFLVLVYGFAKSPFKKGYGYVAGYNVYSEVAVVPTSALPKYTDLPTTQSPNTTPVKQKLTSSPSTNVANESVLDIVKIIAIAVGGLIAILIVVVVIAITLKKKRGHNGDHEDTQIPTSTILRENQKEQEVEPVFANLEMDRSMLKIEDELGVGQFGVVYKGFALGVGDNKMEYVPVAVKGLKKNANRSMKEDFLDEIKLIIEIGSHPNILSIFGCITVNEPYYLVTEFMEYGDLQHFLWRCKEEKYILEDPIYAITDVTKLQIAHQIARGMEYLSQTRYYHGDLAARNILVGKELVVKMSDFGMAEDIYMREYKRMAPERKRPVKWVSLETNTTGRCSIKSDVWSFGIVLYEIYTLGGVPYPTMDAKTVLDKLLTGYRMEKPTNCPNDVYDVMLKCWSEKPDDRPLFRELYLTFDKMLASHSDYMGGFDVMDDIFDETTPDDGYEKPNVVITSHAYANQITNMEDYPKSRMNSYIDMKPKEQPPMSGHTSLDGDNKTFGEGEVSTMDTSV
ncbi:uncharacterized protein [Amphiura filiformis]|uniref:uncharacterized protein n=1 Tax=Amphiura filiformis TaxID=82378 RepID=UPI003B217B61